MRVYARGQVTIQIGLREKAGLTPNTDVVFKYDGHSVRIILRQDATDDRGALIVARLRGAGDSTMTTDEIMALTRR